MKGRLLRPLSCRLCKRNFNSFDRLQVHKYRHTAKFGRWQRKFVSTQCFGSLCMKRRYYDYNFLQRSFSRNFFTLPIIILIFIEGKCYQCEYCYTRFSESGSLKRHITQHTEEKPYRCEYCQERFVENSDLKKHITSHTKEKLYQCEYCQKRFSQVSELKKHIRTHTKEKPYQREYCQKRFATNSHLKSHMNAYTTKRNHCSVNTARKMLLVLGDS